MKLTPIALVLALAASPLLAQEAPEAEGKVKGVRIENGKVIELDEAEARKQLEEARKHFERMRREMEERMEELRRQFPMPALPDFEELERRARDVERRIRIEGDFPGLPEEARARIREALEKARKAAEKGKDTDIDIEEKAEDGSYHVKIRIVRKTSKTESAEGEIPKNEPETPKQEPAKTQ